MQRFLRWSKWLTPSTQECTNGHSTFFLPPCDVPCIYNCLVLALNWNVFLQNLFHCFPRWHSGSHKHFLYHRVHRRYMAYLGDAQKNDVVCNSGHLDQKMPRNYIIIIMYAIFLVLQHQAKRKEAAEIPAILPCYMLPSIFHREQVPEVAVPDFGHSSFN